MNCYRSAGLLVGCLKRGFHKKQHVSSMQQRDGTLLF